MQADFDLPPERLDLLAKSAEGSACELPRAGAASSAGSVAALPASLSSEMALQTQLLLRNFAVRWERLHLIKSASSSLALMRPWSRRKMRVCSSGVSVVPGAAYTASASLIRQPRLILTVAKTCASAHLM